MQSGTTWSSRELTKTIWHNSWPLLGLMLLNFLVGYTDIYVAGLLSSSVQAAVGLISQQYFILIIVANALGVGTVALVSQATGRHETSRVIGLTRQSLLLAAFLGALISIVVLAGADRFIALIQIPAELVPLAVSYLRIYALVLLPNTVIIVAGAVFRAVGRPLIAFEIMAFVTVLNLLACFGLVFGFGPLPSLGYTGIAWAAVIAMSAGLGAVVWVLRRAEWRSLWTQPWNFSKSMVLSIARISWPAVLLQIGWNAGNLALYYLLGRLGDKSIIAMAAYSNGLRLESITYLPAFALNMAAAVLVGQSLGSGSIKEARRVGWRMAVIGSSVLSAFAVLIFWMAPWLAGLLTSNQEVWKETVNYLRINLLVVPLMVISMVLGGSMQGAGDTRGVMVIIVLAIWVIRIPLAAYLCLKLQLGATGVWLAMDVSMIIQMVLMTTRFARGQWHKRLPGEQER